MAEREQAHGQGYYSVVWTLDEIESRDNDST